MPWEDDVSIYGKLMKNETIKFQIFVRISGSRSMSLISFLGVSYYNFLIQILYKSFVGFVVFLD